MLFFLQLVAAFVVAFVLFSLIIYLWLRWKLRSWAEKLVNESLLSESVDEVPPLRLSLMGIDGHEWDNQQQVDDLSRDFEKAGFERIGDFEMDPIDMVCRAFTHRRNSAYAVVYEHPVAGVWYDIVSFSSDHSESLTFSTGQQAGHMDRPEGSILTVLPDSTHPGKAFESFLKERRQRIWAPTEPGEFVKGFEERYAREMDWRMQRGGPTAEEIRRLSQMDGTPVTEEAIALIRQSWSAEAETQYEELLDQEFRQQFPMSPKEWKTIRDDLVYVHAHTSASTIYYELQSAADRLEEDEDGKADDIDDDDVDYGDDEEDDDYDEDDDHEAIEEIRRRIDQSSPRQVFSQLLLEKGLTDIIVKRGTLTKPIETDVYVNPS